MAASLKSQNVTASLIFHELAVIKDMLHGDTAQNLALNISGTTVAIGQYQWDAINSQCSFKFGLGATRHDLVALKYN